MSWTPLHAALGETEPALTYDLIDRACASKVSERSDLDWKQQLPLTAGAEDRAKKIAQQAELAKDIAAMANSGGGMIVYGIAESNVEGTSAADRVVPVGRVDETILRAIRQVAGNLVYPPVTGLQLRPTAPVDAPEEGVLVLLVPDSPEAPHLIHPRNIDDWFGVPYRHGPDTDWMVERQIASAYRARETGRRQRLQDFDDRFDRFLASCGGSESTNWIAAMAIPETPLPRPRELRLDAAHRIIQAAWQWAPRRGIGPRDLTHDEVTRRGLQRFVRTGRRTFTQAGGATARARIEVHGDGAVAVAFTRDGVFHREGKQPGHIAIPDIEQTGTDFFALVWSTHQFLGVSGDYQARLMVHPTTQVFRRLDPLTDAYFPFDESHRVRGYGPVDGPILTSAGLDQAVSSWLDLITDAVNQAGVACGLRADDLILGLRMSD